MTRINEDTDRVSLIQRRIRKEDRNQDIDGDIFRNNSRYPFRFKKPDWNRYGMVYTMFQEEDVKEDFLYPYFKPDWTLFDIGAAYATWSMNVLAFSEKSSAIAFEPDPRVVKAIWDNMDLNEGFRKRFTLVEKGVWSENAEGAVIEELEEVPMISIDSFVEESGIVPNYMTIDIEGAEVHMIYGAMYVIEKYKPLLMIEHHMKVAPYGKDLIMNTLTDLGYKHRDGKNLNNEIIYSLYY